MKLFQVSTMKLRPRFLVGAAAVIALPGSSSAVATAATAAVASSAPQSSATTFAAEADAYQNSTLATAMTQVPGGTKISASQVEWHHGA